MTIANRFDRATVALGAGAVASSLFALTNGDPWELARVRGPALIVVFVLGALAVVAGMRGIRGLTLAVAAAFLVAAAVQLVQAHTAPNWLAGHGATAALLLGFGVGLLALGLARRD